jgi:multiple sugar transport system substrate-binding protein
MNSHINKKVAICLAAGALTSLFSLAGCNPTTPASSTVADPYVNYDTATLGDPKQLTADISFWDTAGKANGDALNSLLTEFKKVYPNITVTIAPQGGYGDIQTKINTALSSGTTPTMAYCYPDHVANYLAANGVMNIDNFVNDPVLGFSESEGSHKNASGATVSGKEDFVPAYWNEGTAYQTKGTYSVPFCKSTEALYYNQTLFDQYGYTVPTTWDEMWTLCAKIKQDQPNKIALGYDADANLFISMCEQMGIPYTSATGDHFLFNNAQAKAMMQTFIDKYNDGVFVTKGTLPNGEYTSTKFLEQTTLMIVSSTAGTSYASTDTFKVGVAAVPHVTDKSLKVIQQGPSICFFQRGTMAQKYAAWLFYKFCTQATNSAYLATSSTGYDPVRTSSYETSFYKDWLDENSTSLYGRTAKVTDELRDNYFYSPVFVGSSKARDAVGTILGAVVQSGKTLDAAFSDALASCVNS